MAGKQRYTPQQVIAALHTTRGLVFLAAERLGCDPDTITNYCKRYPTVQAAKDAERGRLVDLAESKLLAALEAGEPWAITLTLKTLGKDRGYTERQELSGALAHTHRAAGVVTTTLREALARGYALREADGHAAPDAR
jgi:hypothetical protein